MRLCGRSQYRGIVFVTVALMIVVTQSRVGADEKKNTGPSVSLPATITTSPNRYFFVTATTNCPSLKWIIPTGLDKFDPSQLLIDPSNIKPNVVCLVGDAGTYTLQCYGALNNQASDIATCTITIATPAPTPTALTTAIQNAYNADTGTDKAASLAFLKSAYKAMATAAGSATPAAPWSSIKTLGDADAAITAVLTAPSVGLNSTQIVGVRKAIMADYTAKLGTTNTTPITLSALAAELNTISAALNGVSTAMRNRK